MKLNLAQEILLALCLKNSSKEDIRKHSIDTLKQKILEFLDSLNEQQQQDNLNELPIDLLQQILIEINNNNQNKSDYSELIKKLFAFSPTSSSNSGSDTDYVPEILQPLLNSNKNFNLKQQTQNEDFLSQFKSYKVN